MEFPELGDNCSVTTCKQLDFLPLKCDACHKIFCTNHFSYAKHSCTESYAKDNQVPVCPLCNALLPVKKGESPDIRVGQHIDNDCQSDPAKEKRKVYTNRCAVKGCKQKELIPMQCACCQRNFCIRHRLEVDHGCAGFENTGRGVSRAGAAAAARFTPATKPKAAPPSSRNRNLPAVSGRDWDRDRQSRQAPVAANAGHSLQAGMSEDEAMARAIALSLQMSDPKPKPKSSEAQAQEDEDLALARALQASEQTAAARRTQRNKDKTSCVIN